jgi:hypothetical protein
MLADKISTREKSDTYLKDYLEASANIAKVGGMPKPSPSPAPPEPVSKEIKVNAQRVFIRVRQPEIKVENN